MFQISLESGNLDGIVGINLSNDLPKGIFIMAAPALINLWNNYPAQAKPCDGAWDNQCAIRLSITLNAEQTSKGNKDSGSESGNKALQVWVWEL